MAVTAAIDTSYLGTPDVTKGEQFYVGTLTLSGNYGTSSSHGDTLSFANISGLLSQSAPIRVEIYEQPAPGTAPSYYSAVYQKKATGATIANGAVNFSLAGTEYTEASAYSGVISTAVWKFRAWFPLGL
jgi:hypothetical protein